ncbi:hypothetical protein L2V99_27660, partial [Escherichia coli]|uniref:hypothetical protein n=2 Tax=Escherichia coli TaxID=562 RepID=UPI001F241CBD
PAQNTGTNSVAEYNEGIRAAPLSRYFSEFFTHLPTREYNPDSIRASKFASIHEKFASPHENTATPTAPARNSTGSLAI